MCPCSPWHSRRSRPHFFQGTLSVSGFGRACRTVGLGVDTLHSLLRSRPHSQRFASRVSDVAGKAWGRGSHHRSLGVTVCKGKPQDDTPCQGPASRVYMCVVSVSRLGSCSLAWVFRVSGSSSFLFAFYDWVESCLVQADTLRSSCQSASWEAPGHKAWKGRQVPTVFLRAP